MLHRDIIISVVAPIMRQTQLEGSDSPPEALSRPWVWAVMYPVVGRAFGEDRRLRGWLSWSRVLHKVQKSFERG